MSYKYIQGVILFSIIGMLYFLYFNKFGGDAFQTNLYYLWIKIKELLLWVAIFTLTRGRIQLCVFFICIFYALRCLWQIAEVFYPPIVNYGWTIDVLFMWMGLICLFIIFVSDSSKFYLFLKNKFKWWLK